MAKLVRYFTAATIEAFADKQGSNNSCATLNDMAHSQLGLEGKNWRNPATRVQAMEELILENKLVVSLSTNKDYVDSDGDLCDVDLHIQTKDGQTARKRIGYVKEAVFNSLDTNKPEFGKMKKVAETAKKVGSGMVDANKQAFGMAATMQVGRANNKAIKEAVRPLVKLMFKPSFMQRLLAKVFKRENPIDQFLDSPYGSLFAAQLAQGLVTARGIENEKIKAVTVGGIAYAYNELGDLIPLEKTVDEVINKLTEAAEKVVK